MFELALEDRVARLTLNRPDARNAIPAAGWARLAETAERAAGSDAALILIEGEGEAFCAGADLSDFPAMRGDPAAAGDLRRSMSDCFARLRALPVPLLANVDGPCFGAGVALAMACDLRLAGAKARFAITPAKFGISYPHEDVQALVALVGPGQAARLLFSGEAIDSDEALRIGLAELPASALDPLVAAIRSNSAASLATLKRGIRLAAADEAQDRRFDELLAGDELPGRLEALGLRGGRR